MRTCTRTLPKHCGIVQVREKGLPVNSTSSNIYEAYVINEDGTKTAVPMGFADKGPAGRNRNGQPFAARFGQAQGATGYTPQSPYTTVRPQTATPRRSLHLGRRLAGLAIAAVGVPLLILPGPGLALIGLGLMMAVMP